MNSIPIQLGALTPTEDRVRARTKSDINAKLDDSMEQRIRYMATQSRSVISDRILELDREWDIERALEANAASISILGFVLGVGFSRKWFVLPAIVGGFLLNHAIKGWCPPVPILRKVGFRTRSEIERERYALKILRGDFDELLKKAGQPVRDAAGLLAATRI